MNHGVLIVRHLPIPSPTDRAASSSSRDFRLTVVSGGAYWLIIPKERLVTLVVAVLSPKVIPVSTDSVILGPISNRYCVSAAFMAS